MPINCPYCSRPMPSAALEVDLNSNTAYFDGKAVKLRPSGAEILYVLLQHVGKTVSIHALKKACYSGVEGVNDNTLSVHISNVRKLIKPHGWEIRSFWGRGYVLSKSDAMPAGGVQIRSEAKAS